MPDLTSMLSGAMSNHAAAWCDLLRAMPNGWRADEESPCVLDRLIELRSGLYDDPHASLAVVQHQRLPLAETFVWAFKHRATPTADQCLGWMKKAVAMPPQDELLALGIARCCLSLLSPMERRSLLNETLNKCSAVAVPLLNVEIDTDLGTINGDQSPFLHVKTHAALKALLDAGFDPMQKTIDGQVGLTQLLTRAPTSFASVTERVQILNDALAFLDNHPVTFRLSYVASSAARTSKWQDLTRGLKTIGPSWVNATSSTKGGNGLHALLRSMPPEWLPKLLERKDVVSQPDAWQTSNTLGAVPMLYWWARAVNVANNASWPLSATLESWPTHQREALFPRVTNQDPVEVWSTFLTLFNETKNRLPSFKDPATFAMLQHLGMHDDEQAKSALVNTPSLHTLFDKLVKGPFHYHKPTNGPTDWGHVDEWLGPLADQHPWSQKYALMSAAQQLDDLPSQRCLAAQKRCETLIDAGAPWDLVDAARQTKQLPKNASQRWSQLGVRWETRCLSLTVQTSPDAADLPIRHRL